MTTNELKNMIVLIDNTSFIQRAVVESAGIRSKRVFGREIQNFQKNIVTPPRRRHKMMDIDECSEEKERCTSFIPGIHLKKSFIFEEHALESLRHLQTRETLYQVDREYMSRQRDINAKMRGILIDWLVDVCLKFELQPSVFPTSVCLIDRYLDITEISRSKLQLVGVSCLMICSKFEEVYPPMLKDYLSVCDNAYSKAELLQMESDILLRLKFDVSQTSAYGFLSYYQSFLKLDEKSFFFAQYVLESALLEMNYLKYKSSVLAGAAIFFVNKLFKQEGWTIENERLTNLRENDLKVAAKDLFVSLQKNENGELKAVIRKFSETCYFEVSNYQVRKGTPNSYN